MNKFLQTVTGQIRSKEAKTYVKNELDKHLLNSKNAWLEKGYNEEEAEEKAVQEMGSPLTLGKSLNKLHKPKVDWVLIGLLSITLLLSFLPIMAVKEIFSSDFNFQALAINKAVFSIMGLCIAIGIMFFDYRKLKNFGYWFYLAGIGLIVIIHLFSNELLIGEPIISLGFVKIQTWMALPLLLIAWATLLSTTSFKLWQGIALFLLSIFVFTLVGNLPMLFIYIVIVGVLFVQSKFSRKEKFWVVSSLSLIVVGIFVFTTVAIVKGMIAEYQYARFASFLNPEKYETGFGYLYLQLEKAITNAGWFGANELVYLPDTHTNFVLATLIQTYGYLMGLLIIGILTFLAVRICQIAISIKDPFGKLLIMGGVTLFTTQFLYSVGMTFGVFPIVSMSLPFMSYGLMPTVLNAFIVGIALSVYRKKPFVLNRVKEPS
ncbi:FtsW/RodA/SpoVE family cell cycle protein [Ureibacillus xyleni]|nr:FtsW/RodA/SpoVE family cell cycle protein [Ureibacillus xyleni]